MSPDENLQEQPQGQPREEENITDSFSVSGGKVNSANQPSLQAQNQSINEFSSEEGIDPITEAIRREILDKQRELLKNYMLEKHPELAEQLAKDDKDKQDLKFREFLAKAENEELVKEALKEKKTELESFEVEGYKTVLNNPNLGFSSMKWDTEISGASDLRAQKMLNDNGEEICTIQETTKNNSLSIQREDGTTATIAKHRIVDFPVKLDGADGRMHLAMVAYDENGKPSREATFTAHYEEPVGGGKPLLKEVSHPIPLKFTSNDPDAIAYVERAGKIYTLPVTREKYEAMVKEVAINLGQERDQNIVKNQEIETNISSSLTPSKAQEEVITPAQQRAYTGIVPSSQPTKETIIDQQPPIQGQQSKGVDIPDSPAQNPFISAAADVGKALQTLLNELENNLQSTQDKNLDIKNSVDQVLNNPFIDNKKEGIEQITGSVLNNNNLTNPEKITGVKQISEAVVANENINEPEKASILVGVADTVLKNKNLLPEEKQQALEHVTGSALTLSLENAKNAVDGIVDTVAKSDLDPADKGTILGKIIDQILAKDNIADKDKAQMLNNIFDKGVQVQALDEEQRRKIEENISKLEPVEIQKAKEVLNGELNPAEKRKSVNVITKEVLDSDKSIDNKSQIIGGITREVANSTLPIEEKKDIIQGMATEVASSHAVDLKGKEQIVSAMSKGVADSKAPIQEKIEMTEAIGAGISQSQAQDQEKEAMIGAIKDGVEQSNVSSDLKSQLNSAVQGIAKALTELIQTVGGKGQELSEVDKFNQEPDKVGFLKDRLNAAKSKEEKTELISELIEKNDKLGNNEKENLLKETLKDQSVENNIVLREALDVVTPLNNNINRGQEASKSSAPPPKDPIVASIAEVEPPIAHESATKTTEDKALQAAEAEGMSNQNEPTHLKGISEEALRRGQIFQDLLTSTGDLKKGDFSKKKEELVNEYSKLNTLEEKEKFVKEFGKENKLSKTQETQVIDGMLQKEAERGEAFTNNSKATEVEVQTEEKKFINIGDKDNTVERSFNIGKPEIVNTKGNLEIMKMLNDKKAELNKPVQKIPNKQAGMTGP